MVRLRCVLLATFQLLELNAPTGNNAKGKHLAVFIVIQFDIKILKFPLDNQTSQMSTLQKATE